MSGFIRRYPFLPGIEVISEIEGVVIADLPPPGAINGVSTGVVAVVGEFADSSFAVTVDGSGNVATNVQPQEVFSSQDLIDKVGGFDETIGDFGLSEGNGFVALRNKRFSRLIVAPVNLSSSKGCRYFRQLPLCTSQTDPTPVVPVQGATVRAGLEFRNSTTGRVRIAARTIFTSTSPFAQGTAGATTNAGVAATQSFTVTGADFSTVPRSDGHLGVKKGDIVVIGNNNAGALQPLPAGGSLGAGTYRVAVDASSVTPTVLSLEQLNGANFAFVTASNIPFRVHVSSDADSAPIFVIGSSLPGGYGAPDVGGYGIPTRPLTNETGGNTDGTWTAGVALVPAVVPPALTGSSADPLSGLGGRVIPTGGMPFVAAVSGINAPASASLDAQYALAFNALVSDQDPISDINILFAARTSANIRTSVVTNVGTASGLSAGRVGINRPPLSVQTTSAAVSGSDPGVGAHRDERLTYTWPGVLTFVPEAVDNLLKVADGSVTPDGLLDVGADGFLASVMSNLAPERNPGQGAQPVPQILAPILGLQRGAPLLQMSDYIVMRNAGICGIRMDKTVGPVFQSGVTTSLISGQKNISRRRMADYIEDSIARRLVQFSKLPLTNQNKDNAVAEVDTFLSELLSADNPAAQRIESYVVDDRSGNTPSSLARGIFVIIIRVRTLATGDFILLQSEIGENVITTNQLTQ